MGIRSSFDKMVGLFHRVRIIWPVIKLAWYYLEDGNTWKSVDHHVPLRIYGSGCQKDFEWYFEGKSQISASNIAELCEWLAGCEYVRDPDLFHLSDFWQHPTTFEQIRKGDCDDHAIWAWRRLCELGYPAELMVGVWVSNDDSGQHAWVAFEKDGERFVLESMAGEAHKMVKSLMAVKDEYNPHFAVDGNFKRKVYSGIIAKYCRSKNTT